MSPLTTQTPRFSDAPTAPASALDAAATGTLSETALGRVAAAVSQERPATGWVGRYRLVEVIGEGGMGTVWRAEQEQPIRRTVALKVIKPGMDSREVVARFEAERQALALMNHPNVARVLDAGATELGRPYFVMEYVPGEPITAFCDRHRYTLPHRLRLFAQACAAVQHAHEKGVLHRDLKPGNILVADEGGQPRVKVIDFGVAKALQPSQGDHSLHTLAGQLVGTPEYMSPEQAATDGRDIDTRSDIYSLGVVLYELLAGFLPLDPGTLRGSGVAEMLRAIREVEPRRPSTRLGAMGAAEAAEIAGRRRTRVRELAGLLGRELEWVPLKAIRKERSARYATASELARDVENYLGHRPLLAGPESAGYRLRKFVRRRRVEVGAGAMVAVSLLAGMVGTATFAVRAERRAAETRQVADFQARILTGLDVQGMGRRLRQDLLDEAEENWRRSDAGEQEVARRRAELESLLAGANFTNPAVRSLERDVLDRALETVEREFAGQPLVKARLLQNLADTLRDLTRLDRATGPQAEALDFRLRVLGDEHPDTVASIHSTGLLLAAKGKWAEAEPYARDALGRRVRALGEHDRRTLASKALLAEVLQRRGRLREAEPLRREVMHGCRRALGRDDPDSLEASLMLGQVLTWRYKLGEADSQLGEAIADMRRVYGDDDWRTRKANLPLGNLRRLQGRLDEAGDLFQKAYEGSRAAHGDHHRDTLYHVYRIGQVLRLKGELGRAESNLRRAAGGFRLTLGNDHWDTLEATNELGLLLMARRDFAGAEEHLERARAGLGRTRGEDNEQTLWARIYLGRLRQARGDDADAARRYGEVYDEAARASIEPGAAAQLMSFRGPSLVRLGRFDEAEGPLLEAYGRLKGTRLDRSDRLRAVVAALAELCDRTGRPEEAARYRSELAALKGAP